METIQGTIKKVIFNNEESSFKVLKLKTSKGPYITITGEFGPDIISGTIADFHGNYRNHPKYGTNFRVSGYHIIHNVEELTSIQLFLDSISPNIGVKRACRIVNHFGNDIINILNNNPQRITEIEGIGKILAQSLEKAWNKNKDKWNKKRQEYTLRAFLYSFGIKERRIKKIINFFGGGLNAEEKIRENPYKLTEIEGFGFSTADFVARKLGISESSPLRLQAFILYAINVLCTSAGHLYLTTKNLSNIINRYIIENSTNFIGKIKLKPEDLNEAIKNLVQEKLIVQENEALYSFLNFIYEKQSAFKISKILNKSSDLIFLTEESITKHIKSFEKEHRILLSEKQKEALYYFASKKVYIITGGPGTGKSLICKTIVNLALKLNLRLTCLAPTGIAAKKLSLIIGHEASTIHRCLGYRGSEWLYDERNKYETDIVICDESSMLDQEVFYRLLSALPERVHIILVGDDDQLPSVSAGNVLRELINCKEIPVIKFDQIFRQDEASDIIKVAHKIKNGDTNLSYFKSDPGSDVFFIRENNIQLIENFLIKLARTFKDKKRLFQIIAPRNQGPLSVYELNNSLQNALNSEESEKEYSLGKFVVRRGDRVIITKNDYELEVFNGEIGKITHLGNGFITINLDKKEIRISLEEAAEKIKLAYVLSVHKSQGQEYPYIILPFITQYGKNMLQRNLLYTAITRAKRKVIIIGHGAALERAINNSSVSIRNTKLGERIQKCLNKKKDFLQIQPGAPADYPAVLYQKEPLL
ncbi:ATP-dependent RecD-like DNA helicase [candidate division KSB1 bacterium]|nr:MAG: ATP-dependent RecD-like DNA helicase [candidate division KSB1 bacterium]